MAPPFRDLVLVGRVVKPHGRHGEVAVAPLSDRPDRFPTLREVVVRRCRPHKGSFVLEIEGVSSIDEAETLRGLALGIEEAELAALPEGSYYHHQLRGLRVEDEAGAEMGVVDDVVETGAEARVLVVRGPGGETLLPFAADFVRVVDLARGRLVAQRPEYVVAD
jgi:16S rRNA processing protein RimM